MESRRSRKRLLALVLAVALLLILQPASAVPTSRSMHMMRSQQHPPSLQFAPQEMSLGRAAARMDVEVVNDYPGSGANNRHDPPKGP